MCSDGDEDLRAGWRWSEHMAAGMETAELKKKKRKKAQKKPTVIYGCSYMSGQMMFSGYKGVLNLS